ncbi:DCC1-like thiol-disulfide oxidoreductase family protein [Halarchaeum sp. P4]|uniref:DCC1-like thiol-disulfide oxidoreductase family protein n=1 Tax=Halarchaeum sp. P4 TaxID=3421639 RepID=UPI003EB8BCDA
MSAEESAAGEASDTREEYTPRLVYDDDCGFCTWCAEQALEHGEFEAVGFSELTPDQKARLPDDYETSTHLLTDDAVYSAGEAVEQALVRMFPELEGVVDELREFELYRDVREGLYRWGANRRDWWGKIVSATPPAGQ